ncbi:ABC transporter ATP-binding protein [Brachybacterium huguangmaarense]
MSDPLLSVSDLSVSFKTPGRVVDAVKNLSYEVHRGEALAIVGESGSGKSVSSLAVMGLLPSTARVTGDIRFAGHDMLAMNDKQLSKIRGDKIAMVFQDPLSALTPVYTVGDQIVEAVRLHEPSISKARAAERAIELLGSVGIPDPRRRAKQFPHEFSGGMRQRAMIAMAIANGPDLIIADEPTTALDVTIQAQVMDLLKTAQEMLDAATVLITHDLGVVAGFADRVLVMEKAVEVERGTVDDVFYRPLKDYTKRLLAAVPRVDEDESDHSDVNDSVKVLEVDDLERVYPITKGMVFRRQIGEQRAVDGISFHINESECLALVGESGCGKTTTLMEIMKLAVPQGGTIRINGKDTSKLSADERAQMRSDVAIVFQDPMSALDPRLPVNDILREQMQLQGWDRKRQDERVAWLLETVGLLPEHADRYPHEFSGGQRQRIGVARALACEPKIIILDEPTSALDVTIQAGVLELLERLKTELKVSYLFVSHDLSVVRAISDRIAVMYKGKIVEQGDTAQVFENPQHPYTRALLSSVPIPDPNIERGRERILYEPEAAEVDLAAAVG